MLLFVSFYKRYFQIKRDVLHLSIKHFREIRKIHRVLEKRFARRLPSQTGSSPPAKKSVFWLDFTDFTETVDFHLN